MAAGSVEEDRWRGFLLPIVLIVFAAVGWAVFRPSRPVKRDIYVLTVDTLRADHLGVYGYGRATSRNLDAFAASAIVFEDVVATSSWTLPSVGSLMTGVYPPVHGLRARLGEAEFTALRPGVKTLAEVLRSEGYRTRAIVTNPWMVRGEHGLERGFEEYYEIHTAPAAVVNNRARGLIAGEDERPLFLYLHYYDPHGPYNRHGNLSPAVLGPLAAALDRPLSEDELGTLPSYLQTEGLENLGDFIDAYDLGVYAWDREFGKWIGWIDRLERYRETRPIVVVVSDHGEEFVEHGGWNHGETLYQEQVEIPWLMRHPDHPPERIESAVSLVDLMPTVLAAVGIESPEATMGRDVLGQRGRTDRFLYSESDVAHGGAISEGLSRISIRRGDRKLVVVQSEGSVSKECFDLDADPVETNGSCDEGWASSLQDELDRWIVTSRERAEELGSSPKVPLAPDDRERLRALGYGD